MPSQAPIDQTQLLLRIGRGDESAARALWELHGAAMIAYARAVLGAAMAHEAEDVVQTVMCSILRTPARTLARLQDVRAWLGTATRRSAINRLRSAGREARRRRAASPPAQRTPPAPGSETLEAAIQRLPRRLREVVFLKHYAGLTFDQMALSLDRSRSTLATQHQSALEQLRAMLQIEPGPPGAIAGHVARAATTELAVQGSSKHAR